MPQVVMPQVVMPQVIMPQTGEKKLRNFFGDYSETHVIMPQDHNAPDHYAPGRCAPGHYAPNREKKLRKILVKFLSYTPY